MKKKIITIITILMIGTMLVACGASKRSEDQIKSDTSKEVSDKAEDEEDTALAEIETKYGTLCYPAKWKDVLITNESEEDGILSVTFETNVGEQNLLLFKVLICAEEGDSIGTITDDGGNIRNVFVDVQELGDLSNLDTETQDRVYAMQEAVNVIGENLQ